MLKTGAIRALIVGLSMKLINNNNISGNNSVVRNLSKTLKECDEVPNFILYDENSESL